MRINRNENEVCIENEVGQIVFELNEDTYRYSVRGKVVYIGKININVDTTNAKDDTYKVDLISIEEESHKVKLIFSSENRVWDKKLIVYEIHNLHIESYAIVSGTNKKITDIVFGGFERKEERFQSYYAPRFDWEFGEVVKSIEEDDILSCQQWLSPPLFCYVFKDEDECVPIFVAAKQGENNYVSMKHHARTSAISLQFEGHQEVDGCYESPTLVLGRNTESLKGALKVYKEYLVENNCVVEVEEKEIPSWWKEPIFCGWGEMRYEYRADHDNHENGNFINVTDYCTEKRYNNYIKTLEENGVNPGTIIIDMGWALNPALAEPNEHKWDDMRAFIDREHEKGRHVLLWYTPVVTQGLPDEACLMLNDRAVAPDPTNPIYKEILEKEIYKMLSSDEGCLNADGFKIDFTQNTPSEEGIFKCYLNTFFGLINETNEEHLYVHREERDELISVYEKNVWGVELLKAYIKNLYVYMKKVKGDSVLITHTPNPYFAEVVDVLRLNDLDGVSPGVLEIMKMRALIAETGCDKWLIDTDNDLMVDKEHWRDYIKMQLELGIPDTYYSSHIAASNETFGEVEYAILREVFDEYRSKMNYS